jgi:hypothetical protein
MRVIKNILAMSLCMLVMSPVWADALPSIHDIYAAAKAGKLDQAQSMVDKVLAAKPNSAKAHFVKAELCASQSDINCVRDELSSAKKIDAGLAFANPASVKKLENVAAGGTAIQPIKSGGSSGFPWGWLLAGVGIIALLWWIVSLGNRRGAMNSYPVYNGGPVSPTVPGPGMSGMSPGYGTPMQTGGFGSTLGKSLATGAALGAGMVAGEAIADSFLHHGQSAPAPDAFANPQAPDLGGSDFGISGGDSWDSSSSGLDSLGGSDW